EVLDVRCMLAGDLGLVDTDVPVAVRPDVNRDGIVSPVDVLQVINVLSVYQLDSHVTFSRAGIDTNPLTDADQDGEITTDDFDIVFNSLGQ
ncbi:MAG: dockerin type I domain-containing protein, partial [Rubripirellula sp.]